MVLSLLGQGECPLRGKRGLGTSFPSPTVKLEVRLGDQIYCTNLPECKQVKDNPLSSTIHLLSLTESFQRVVKIFIEFPMDGFQRPHLGPFLGGAHLPSRLHPEAFDPEFSRETVLLEAGVLNRWSRPLETAKVECSVMALYAVDIVSGRCDLLPY